MAPSFHATRRPGWDAALVAAVEAHRDRPFQWGESDCIVLVADVVQAMTGIDPMTEWRGRYGDELEAMSTLRAMHHRTVGGVLSATFARIAPALARRGDCGVVETLTDGRRQFGAVVVLGNIVVGKSPTARHSGLVHLPRARLLRSYRIG